MSLGSGASIQYVPCRGVSWSTWRPVRSWVICTPLWFTYFAGLKGSFKGRLQHDQQAHYEQDPHCHSTNTHTYDRIFSNAITAKFYQLQDILGRREMYVWFERTPLQSLQLHLYWLDMRPDIFIQTLLCYDARAFVWVCVQVSHSPTPRPSGSWARLTSCPCPQVRPNSCTSLPSPWAFSSALPKSGAKNREEELQSLSLCLFSHRSPAVFSQMGAAKTQRWLAAAKQE